MSWRWTGTTKKTNVRKKRAERNRALTAIDEWMDEIQTSYEGPFASEGERLAFYYKGKKGDRRAWERPRRCMFPNCNSRSIARSHTLPRSGPLSLVAEDGHVITPEFVRDDVYFTRVGIGDASTFPGFCSTHEAEFGEIDRLKDVKDERHWLLQFFRTVCWELRIIEHEHERFRKLGDDYESILRKHATESLRSKLGKEVRVQRVSDIDNRQSVARRERERLEALKNEYTTDFFEPLCDALGGGDPSLGIVALNVETEALPVCLAGRGNFHCETPDGVVDVPVFLQVFPGAKGTKIGMLSSVTGEKYLGTYLESFIREQFGVLNMVESWMLHGTDHWFLRPSVWQRIPEDKRLRIEAAFRDLKRSIGERATETIFDDVRASARVEQAQVEAVDAT
jgi:hypothetical protein